MVSLSVGKIKIKGQTCSRSLSFRRSRLLHGLRNMPHHQSNSISYPTPIEVPSHKRHPSIKSHKSKQSSLSGTMAWLSGNKSNKVPYAAATPPLRISEPKLNDAFGRVEQAPAVTIVRTPQEALTSLQKEKEKVRKDSFEHIDSRPKRPEVHRIQTDGSSRNLGPASPPLPPLPDMSRFPPTSPSRPVARPPPQMAPPQAPQPMPSPPRTVKASYPASLNEYSLSAPVEAAPPPSPPLPPFDPILLSAVPSLPIDPKKAIITLETSTESFKTTMATLISREDCRFNGYFTKILTEARKSQHSEASSVYSQSSASGIEENLDSINSIFSNHISASGLLAPTPVALHVFLDRPSAP